MKRKNTHKVTLTQGGTKATFLLSDTEYSSLKGYERPHNPHFMYNTAAHAWAHYCLSRSKRGRFFSLFGYRTEGDFVWLDE